MRKQTRKQNPVLLYPVGSLMAIGEIMLLLWITSLLAGMATHVQISEAPLPPMNDPSQREAAVDHTVIVGKRVALDGHITTVEALVEALHGMPDAKVELRAAHDVDAVLFFRARYSLRQAGIAYVELPPSETQGGGIP